MLSPTFINDGDFGTEVQIQPTQTSYPFGNDPTPDVYPKVYDRMMEIALSQFVPRIEARTPYTNLLTYSDNFSDGSWSKSAATISVDVDIPPWSAAATGDKIAETSANGIHGLTKNYTFLNQLYCLWGVFKASERSFVGLGIVDSALGAAGANFDLLSGQLLSTAGVLSQTQGIVNLGSGHFLCYVCCAPASGAGHIEANVRAFDSYAPYFGSAGNGIFCDQLQLQLGAAWGPPIITGSAAVTLSVPDLAPDDSLAFLVGESKLTVTDGEIAQFTRTFARIPADQVKPGSINFPRPVLHDIKNGTAYAVAFEEDQRLSWIFTSRKTVSSLTAPVVADDVETNTKAVLPGGITINLAGHNGATGTTGSFSTSDSIATIQTAVFNIWTHATVSVTKDAYGISVQSVYSGSGGGSITQVDGSASSAIVVSGSPLNFTIEAAASGKTISTPLDDSIRNVHAVGHGGVVGDRVALWRGDKLIAMGTVVTVPGADDFTVGLDAIPGKNEVVTHCGFSTDAAMCVVNGPKMCDTRHTTRFYLPGYTAGITTDADIPKQAPQVDPISWLGVIIAGTAWPVYQVNEVSQWMGAILQQETITLQLADAVDTVTP